MADSNNDIDIDAALEPRPTYDSPRLNLQLYLSEALLAPIEYLAAAQPDPVLERIPPDTFLLSTTPDSRRRLKVTLRFGRNLIDQRIAKFIERTIPDQSDPVDVRDERRMLVPADSFPSTIRRPHPRAVGVDDIGGVCEWAKRPLETARRAMEMVWPESMRRYAFIGGLEPEQFSQDAPPVVQDQGTSPDPDKALYTSWYWTQQLNLKEKEDACKLVVALVPPWAMGPKDVEDFALGGQFPSFSIVRTEENGAVNMLSKTPSFKRVHKIWAKLWDDCASRRCPFFVLTVYDYWVFGVFTRGWSTAIVSDPIQRAGTGPNVLHWLIYWFASSMGVRWTWKAPDLRPFPNPDIKDAAQIATKLSEDFDRSENKMEKDEEWLEQHLKEQVEGGETKKVVGMENTWITEF